MNIFGGVVIMEIIKNTTIRNRWHRGFERDTFIQSTIIHGAGVVSSVDSLINWMLEGERGESYKNGIALFHYAIDATGEVTEIIDPYNWVYHSSSGIQDRKTIGIELINGSVGNVNSYTDDQYESLIELIFNNIMIDHPTMNVIASHNRMAQKYSKFGKSCPGPGFNWDYLEDYMNENNYTYEHLPQFESYWRITNG